MNNINYIEIFCIIIGLYSTIFYKKLGKSTSDFYFRLLKVRASIIVYQIGFLVAGIILTIFGVLAVLEII